MKWTKKKIITASAIAAAVVIAVVLTLVFTLGGKAEKMAEKYKSSVSSVTSAVTVTEVKNADVVAYTKEETITFTDGDNAEIVTKVTQLSDYKMEFEESETTASGEIDRSSLVAVDLDVNLFKTKSYHGSTFTGKVAAENAAEFFSGGNVSVDGDIDVKVEFKGNRVSTVTCSYKSASGLTTTMTVTYAYGK